MGIRLSRLPATLLALLLPGLVQAAPPGLDRFEGLWESSVVVQDCHSGAVLRTFRGLTVIHRGGTASATNSLPTVANGPAYGTWSRRRAPTPSGCGSIATRWASSPGRRTSCAP